MPWFKVDDKLAFHPKVLAAGNTAIGLWIRAGAWAADQLTDGHIPAQMIPVLGGKPADARRLVDAGLWDRTPNGYQFHDWDDYQPTRQDHDNRVKTGRAGGTLGAHRRWHKDHPSPDCEYCVSDRQLPIQPNRHNP